MTFQAAAITGRIGLDESPTIRAMKNVEAESARMKKAVEGGMTEAGTNGARGFLKGLNSELGKRSLAGQITKLAMGGGAIAGLSMIEGAVKGLTGELVNLKNAWAAGEIGAGELTEKVISQIPVLGRAWQIGRDIRELITGENAALAKQNQALHDNYEARMKVVKAMQAEAEKRANVKKDFGDLVKDIGHQAELLNTYDPTAKALKEKDLKLQEMRDEWTGRVAAAKSARDSAHNAYFANPTEANKQLKESTAATYELVARAAEQARREIEGLDLAQTEFITHGEENAAKVAEFRKAVLETAQGLGPAAGLAGGAPSLADQLAKLASPAQWGQLANPGVRAEDVFGSRRVTTADLPQPWMNAAVMTEKNTKEAVTVLKEMTREFTSGPPAPALNVVTMP